MSFLVLPSQFEQRSTLFHQLGALLTAGLPAIQALEHLAKNPPARSFRRPLLKVLERISQGDTFTGALRSADTWLTVFDLSLIEAAEQSGRMDSTFKMLAGYYRDRAILSRKIISGLSYPLFVLAFALTLFPLDLFTDALLKGKVLPFLKDKAVYFGILFGLPILFISLLQQKSAERFRGVIESFCGYVPLLGGTLRDLSMTRFTAALGALMNAGVSVLPAWDIASRASGSPRLIRTVAGFAEGFELGKTPAQLVTESGAFPDLFCNLYASAEISGQHDQTLERLHTLYNEESIRKLSLIAEWTPRIVYFAVVIYAAFQIVGFWSEHYSKIGGIL
jgi:type II secretory pathway component PulF